MTRAKEASTPAAGLVTKALVAVIAFYRMAISPMRPPACRYAPSCSEYAVDALRTWGPVRGSWLSLRRLLRCHPWHTGGFDPVPARAVPVTCAPSNAVPANAVPANDVSSTSMPVTSAPVLPRAAV